MDERVKNKIIDILKKHNIDNDELSNDLYKSIYDIIHPPCNCKSCCEKRGVIWLEGYYIDDEE